MTPVKSVFLGEDTKSLSRTAAGGGAALFKDELTKGILQRLALAILFCNCFLELFQAYLLYI